MGGKRVVTNSPSIGRHSVIVTGELMTAAAGVATSWMSMVGVTVAVCYMATPSMTNATMGSMGPTEPPWVPTTPMPAASTVPTTATPVPTATAPAGDCRSVRNNAKRADRNARCKSSYCFLLHGAFLKQRFATLASRLK